MHVVTVVAIERAFAIRPTSEVGGWEREQPLGGRWEGRKIGAALGVQKHHYCRIKRTTATRIVQKDLKAIYFIEQSA